MYNRTYNPVGLNKVSQFPRRSRAPSRLTDVSETFCMEGNSEKHAIVV